MGILVETTELEDAEVITLDESAVVVAFMFTEGLKSVIVDVVAVVELASGGGVLDPDVIV